MTTDDVPTSGSDHPNYAAALEALRRVRGRAQRDGLIEMRTDLECIRTVLETALALQG